MAIIVEYVWMIRLSKETQVSGFKAKSRFLIKCAGFWRCCFALQFWVEHGWLTSRILRSWLFERIPIKHGLFLWKFSSSKMDVNEWLVVYLPLWKMMDNSSVGMLFHSQYDGKVIIQPCSKPPTRWVIFQQAMFDCAPCICRIWAPPTVHQIAFSTVGPHRLVAKPHCLKHLQETMVLMRQSRWRWMNIGDETWLKSIKSPSRADDIYIYILWIILASIEDQSFKSM